MIEASGLCKNYGSRTAIRDVSFQVTKGEVLGFLGPNGAGKSTTMKILSGFLAPSAGEARVGGVDMVREPQAAKSKIGYLPEVPPVYAYMGVADFLHFAAELRHVERGRRGRAVDSALERCGLADVRDRLIGNLSKGYRQRVGLAQAIVHDPEVLILDEPTVGLDPEQIIEIRELIKSFAGNHTVILSTHILPEVQATCSSVAVINQGHVVARDSITAITSRMDAGMHFTVTLRRDPTQLDLERVKGVREVKWSHDAAAGIYRLDIACERDADPRAEVSRACVEAQLELIGMQQEQVSLEAAFLNLVRTDKAREAGAQAEGAEK